MIDLPAPKIFKLNQQRKEAIESNRVEIEDYLSQAFGEDYEIAVETILEDYVVPENTSYSVRIESLNMVGSDGSPIVFLGDSSLVFDLTPINCMEIVNNIKKQMEKYYESELRKTSQRQDTSDDRREGRETSIQEVEQEGAVLPFNPKA